MTLQEMKMAQKDALTAAETILKAAESRGNGMTKSEEETYNAKMAEFTAMGRTAAAREQQNTIRNFFQNGKPGPALLDSGPADSPLGFTGPVSVAPVSSETRSPEYKSALLGFLNRAASPTVKH